MAFNFGAPAQGAAAAPAFGAAGGAAPAPAFGAAGGFGAPAPAFGAPSPAPAFGAPAGGGGLFGGGQKPAGGGMFGAAAPAAGGGLFGATPAPAPAAGGGLFGAAPAPAAGGIGIGGFNTTKPAGGGLFNQAAGGGLFSGGAAAPAAGGLNMFNGSAPKPGGLFSQANNATAGQGMFSGNQALPPGTLTAPAEPRPAALGVDRAAHELRAAIAERLATGAANPDAHLSTLCYDLANTSQQAAELQQKRPEHVDPKHWAEAVHANPDPDRLVPVPVLGFQALEKRAAAAQQAIAANTALCEKVAAKAQVLGRAARLNDGLADELRQRNAALQLRLLRVAKKAEAARREHFPVVAEERLLAARLRALEAKALKPARDLDAVQRDAARLRRMAPGVAPDARKEAQAVLAENQAGLTRLLEVARRDLRDVKIMKEIMAKKKAPK